MDIYILADEEQTGPFGEDAVRAMVISGRTGRSDLAWREGLDEWLPVEQVVTLPPRPSPPPLHRRPPPPPLPAGLPPIPASSSARPNAPASPFISTRPASVIRTVSGVVALILGLLTILNVGSCVNASSKLARFQSGNSSLDNTDMMVNTLRGMSENDPLRGVSGLLDKAHSLQDDYDSSQLGAWLALVGASVAGGMCMFTSPRKAA